MNWREPDYEAIERDAAKKRVCPVCSTKGAFFHMRPAIVHNRIAEDGQREPVEGLQVRYRCVLCGFGEVVSFALQDGATP